MERRKKEAVEKVWELVRPLGEGAFGVVWEVVVQSEEKENGSWRGALKIQRPKGAEAMRDVEEEALLGLDMRDLGPGSGLLGVADMCVVASLPKSWRKPLEEGVDANARFPSPVTGWAKAKFKGPFSLVLLPLAEDGSLDAAMEQAADARSPLDPMVAACLIAQGIHATRVLHNILGFQHCDIKPENMVLARASSLPDGAYHPALDLPDSVPRSFLIDYGLAVPLASGSHAGGTVAYLAPEVLYMGPLQRFQAADTWALGMVALELAMVGVPGACFRAAVEDIVPIQHLTEVLPAILADKDGGDSPIRPWVDTVIESSADSEFVCDDPCDAASVISVSFIQAALGHGVLPHMGEWPLLDDDGEEVSAVWAALTRSRDELACLADDFSVNPYLELMDNLEAYLAQSDDSGFRTQMYELAKSLLKWNPNDRPELSSVVGSDPLFTRLAHTSEWDDSTDDATDIDTPNSSFTEMGFSTPAKSVPMMLATPSRVPITPVSSIPPSSVLGIHSTAKKFESRARIESRFKAARTPRVLRAASAAQRA